MRENRNNFNPSERNYETSQNPSELTKKEQEHRHKWQDKYLRTTSITFRLGQVFGFIYNIALLALVYDLIQDGEKSLALKLFFGNIALIAFALLVTRIERKISTRKPPRRGGHGNRDRRFNNNNRDRNNSRDRDNRDRGDRR